MAHPTAAELRGMTCHRFRTPFLFEIQKFHLLATFLFFFSDLRLNISLYNINCSSISNCPYISTITPKMSPHNCFLISGYFLKIFFAVILLIICIIFVGAYRGAAPTKICTWFPFVPIELNYGLSQPQQSCGV